MKKSISAFIKPLDFLFLIIFAGAIVFSFVLAGKGGGKSSRAAITTPEGEFIYPLDKDAVLELKGEAGISKIEIKDGKACFIDSPCPNKTCVSSGKISRSGEWAACLPNKIFLRIEGDGEDSLDEIAE